MCGITSTAHRSARASAFNLAGGCGSRSTALRACVLERTAVRQEGEGGVRAVGECVPPWNAPAAPGSTVYDVSADRAAPCACSALCDAAWLEVQRSALSPVRHSHRHRLEDANERHDVRRFAALDGGNVDAMHQQLGTEFVERSTRQQ
jgi:hypothetical protein